MPYQNVTVGIPLSRISAVNATELVSAATVAIQNVSRCSDSKIRKIIVKSFCANIEQIKIRAPASIYELPERRLLVAKIRNPTTAAVLEALRNLSDDVETKDDFIPLSLSAINSGASFSAAVSSTPLFTASAGIGGILSIDTILNEMQAAAAQISERVAEIRSRKQELVQYTISHSGAVTNDQKEDILSQKKQIISDLEECERMYLNFKKV